MTTIERNGKKLRDPVGSDALSRNGGAFPTIMQHPLPVR